MSNAVFLSYAQETEPWLDDLAGYTHSVGLGITGRFVPVGGALELVPDLRQQLRVSLATVVLFGTSDDATVDDEIEWTREFGKGIVGIRAEPSARAPVSLFEAGAEVLSWDLDDDRRRLPRAITAAVRGARLMERVVQQGTGAGKSCARPTRRTA